MNGNKDFEKLMKDYYAQMQQLIEKNRRLRQENSNGGNAQDDVTENEEAADDMPQATDNADETAAIPTDEPPQEPQNPQEPQEQPSGDNMPPADAFGSLAVQVTTARGAVPVDGALVVISEDGEDGAERMLFTLQTNNSGETQTVRLATYPLSLSQNPDFFGKPYKDYTITTSKPGYYTVINKNVPVFADRFSIQHVNMIALPENFTGDKTIIITERETLQEGMGGQPQTLENRQQKEE
ncbi:MAG: hypothetical protein UH824_05175 [Acutalibacteraceae bacterium]|nr:hypothetical protein [Acutalibacteraceae bacterium]